jgi:hypothetical protein
MNARVFTVRSNREVVPRSNCEEPRRKFQWRRNRGAWSQHRAGPTQNSTGVDGTYSSRTHNRTSECSEYQVRTPEGSAKSGPKNDDRWVPRPHGIRCYNCGLTGHISRICPRGYEQRSNGVGRTKATPPSCPK